MARPERSSTVESPIFQYQMVEMLLTFRDFREKMNHRFDCRDKRFVDHNILHFHKMKGGLRRDCRSTDLRGEKEHPEGKDAYNVEFGEFKNDFTADKFNSGIWQ